MRLSSSQIYQQAVNAMLNKQADLAKTQLQIATGKRILAPSDDPSGATRILDITQAIETTNQYQRNADAAETRLAFEESLLTEVSDVLQRVRELSVQANNDTNSQQDRLAIAQEVRVNVDALVQLANSKDAIGEYVFSGFNTNTIPFTDDGSGGFTYDGDQGQRYLQIGDKRQVATGDSGFDVFMQIDDGAGGKSDMFSVLYDFAIDLEADAPSASTLTRLDSALDEVLNTRTAIGARMNSIDGQRSTSEGFSLVLQENLSNLEDLDYADAISRFEQQILALQASQQSFVKIEGLSLFNYL